MKLPLSSDANDWHHPRREEPKPLNLQYILFKNTWFGVGWMPWLALL
jgi:hypothetical protein